MASSIPSRSQAVGCFGAAGAARMAVGFEVLAGDCQAVRDAAYFLAEQAAQRVAAVEAAGPIAVVAEAGPIVGFAEAHPMAGFAAGTGEDTERRCTGLGWVEDSLAEAVDSLEVVGSLAAAGLDRLGERCQTMGL